MIEDRIKMNLHLSHPDMQALIEYASKNKMTRTAVIRKALYAVIYEGKGFPHLTKADLIKFINESGL